MIDLKLYVELLNEYDDMCSKVQFLVDLMGEEGMLEEDCISFPDGDTWYTTFDEEKVND